MTYVYGQQLPVGVLGGSANVLRRVPVRNNSSATIADGRLVVHDETTGTSDLAVRLPSATSDKVVGVVEVVLTNPDGFTASSVDPMVLGSAVVVGDVYVYTNDAVVRGDPVYFQAVAHDTRAAGTFGNTADTSGSDRAVLIKGQFMEAASAGSMVRIFVNLG